MDDDNPRLSWGQDAIQSSHPLQISVAIVTVPEIIQTPYNNLIVQVTLNYSATGILSFLR